MLSFGLVVAGTLMAKPLLDRSLQRYFLPRTPTYSNEFQLDALRVNGLDRSVSFMRVLSQLLQ